MPRPPRVRRPLLALVALVLAVAIGYGVDALRGSNDGPPAPGTPTVSTQPSAPGR